MPLMPIRLGSMNSANNGIRPWSRAAYIQNCDIQKTNEISKRKGFVRRLEQQYSGPIRLLFAYKGICGRFYSFVDGGGLIFVSGQVYFAPTGASAVANSPVTVSWNYQDKDGVRTTPPDGCSGVKVYRTTDTFATSFDTGTLVYDGDGTSCVDEDADTTATVYYTIYTKWSDQDKIVDPRLVMDWAYVVPAGGDVPDLPERVDQPHVPGSIAGGAGIVVTDNGTNVQEPGIDRSSDEPSKEEDSDMISFTVAAVLVTSITADLSWEYVGDDANRNGYVEIFRSALPGAGVSGTLVTRSDVLTSTFEDDGLNATTSDTYYTFMFYLDNGTTLSYEKTIEQLASGSLYYDTFNRNDADTLGANWTTMDPAATDRPLAIRSNRCSVIADKADNGPSDQGGQYVSSISQFSAPASITGKVALKYPDGLITVGPAAKVGFLFPDDISANSYRCVLVSFMVTSKDDNWAWRARLYWGTISSTGWQLSGTYDAEYQTPATEALFDRGAEFTFSWPTRTRITCEFEGHSLSTNILDKSGGSTIVDPSPGNNALPFIQIDSNYNGLVQGDIYIDDFSVTSSATP